MEAAVDQRMTSSWSLLTIFYLSICVCCTDTTEVRISLLTSQSQLDVLLPELIRNNLARLARTDDHGLQLPVQCQPSDLIIPMPSIF